MTDIVERLRDNAVHGYPADVMREAATEIERLRADLTYADEQAKKLEAIAWPSFELNERLRADADADKRIIEASQRSARQMLDEITRLRAALRDARAETLEEAARVADGEAASAAIYDEGYEPDASFACEQVAATIRALKDKP